MSQTDTPARDARARAVRERAECIHDADSVQTAFDRLAEAISADYADRNPLMLCVMVGGVYMTSELTRRLDFPFELDFLHASRYRGETSGCSTTSSTTATRWSAYTARCRPSSRRA